MKIQIDTKEKKSFLIIFSAIFVCFLISLFVFIFSGQGKKYSFIFPSVDKGEYVVETRFLPKNSQKDEITFYVDELLLGSSLERTKMIFTQGTTIRSCFLRDGILYLDLSAELLKSSSNTILIDEAFELLEQNIKDNFNSVKELEIFVDGKYALENFKKNKSLK
mgnify:FL=1